MQKKRIMLMRKPVITLLGLAAMICLVFIACQKEYSLETNKSLAAEGSLQDTTGTCMPITVVGTFYGGVEPGRDTAYVLLNVNVTNPGSYSIYTNTQDGFYFSDSGYFSTTGINVVKIKPIGVPIIPGAQDFTVSFDSTVCYFTVNVQDSTGTGLGGGGITNPNQSDTAWKFSDGTNTYHGPIDTAYTYTDSLGQFLLNMIGYTSATADSAWEIGVYFSGGQIATGSYQSKASAAFGFVNRSTGNLIYEADPTVQTVNTTIVITSYDTSTKLITGTFSGTAKDTSGNPVTINGSFTGKVMN